MADIYADAFRTLNGIEQLIQSGQLRLSLHAFVEVDKKLCGDYHMAAQVHGDLETKILSWVHFVKENPKCLTEGLDGKFTAARPGNNTERKASINGLFERKGARVVTAQSNEEISFSTTVVSPKEMDVFERHLINRQSTIKLPKRQPVVRLPPSIPKSAPTGNAQVLHESGDHLKENVPCENVQALPAHLIMNKLPAKPKVLSSSIWASATEACSLGPVNDFPGQSKGAKFATHEAYDNTSAVNKPTQPNMTEMQTTLPSSASKHIVLVQEKDLIDLGPLADVANTLVASSDSSDEDLIKFEPKVVKVFKTKGRGKFTMELVHWFTREEKSKAEEKDLQEADREVKSSEAKGIEKSFEDKERQQTESEKTKSNSAKLEVAEFEKGIRATTMLSLRHKVPNALHASLKSRLHVLGLERNGVEWKKPSEGIVWPKSKKERPMGELSYRKTNGTPANRG